MPWVPKHCSRARVCGQASTLYALDAALPLSPNDHPHAARQRLKQCTTACAEAIKEREAYEAELYVTELKEEAWIYHTRPALPP